MPCLISRGLNIFYLIFEYHFFVFKDFFQKILSLGMVTIEKAACNQLSRLLWCTYSKLKGVNKIHSGNMKKLRRTLWMVPMRLIGVGGSENL